MATTTQLSYDQFREQYENGDRDDYEFWYGEAIPKSMPTLVHGLLQQIVVGLLKEHGFIAASEVELRIDPGARPKPDVIAGIKLPPGPYPKKAADLVLEILSRNDSYVVVQEKCRNYQAWGFGRIYLVVPDDRSVLEWRDGASFPVEEFAGISSDRIWKALDEQYSE